MVAEGRNSEETDLNLHSYHGYKKTSYYLFNLFVVIGNKIAYFIS